LRPGVALFPLTREAALRAIRSVAKESLRVSFPPDLAERGNWVELVTHLTIMKCLQEGSLTRDPVAGLNGFWECEVERIAVGQRILVNLALGSIGVNDPLIVITNISVE